MKNHKEIYQALIDGKSLINAAGTIITLNESGIQESDDGENYKYSFDAPSTWQIVTPPKEMIKMKLYAYVQKVSGDLQWRSSLDYMPSTWCRCPREDKEVAIEKNS